MHIISVRCGFSPLQITKKSTFLSSWKAKIHIKFSAIKNRRQLLREASPVPFCEYYIYQGFFIEKLSARAPTARAKSITNGAMYEPEFMSRVFANVAMNDATIRLKLMIE